MDHCSRFMVTSLEMCTPAAASVIQFMATPIRGPPSYPHRSRNSIHRRCVRHLGRKGNIMQSNSDTLYEGITNCNLTPLGSQVTHPFLFCRNLMYSAFHIMLNVHVLTRSPASRTFDNAGGLDSRNNEQQKTDPTSMSSTRDYQKSICT